MVKPNYFLSGRKTEHALRTEIKSGYCVKYEGTVHAITSRSLSWMCDSLRRERSRKLETFKVLRLPLLTLDETLMCFWDDK